MAAQIPIEPLSVSATCHGLNNTAIHRSGQRFRQEAAYTMFWIFAVMLIGAVALTASSWNEDWMGSPIKVKYVIAAAMIIFGFLGGVMPFFVINQMWGVVNIDPQQRIVQIEHKDFHPVIPWDEIVTLQICRQSDPKMPGYQLNLVRRKGDGEIARYCLQSHGSKRCVLGLAKDYTHLFGFPVVDHSE